MNKQEQLEKLRKFYPMFEMTKEEQEYLKRARKILEKENDFICLILDSHTLREKIDKAIYPSGTFPSYIYNRATVDSNFLNRQELRLDWIDCLLEHNRE